MEKKYFIIDFDSTFIKTEGLEELAAVTLLGNPKKNEILKKIKKITDLGMEGKMAFGKSLVKRLNLLGISRIHIEQTVRLLKRKISASILRNRSFFKTYKNQIFIISGGFMELVWPVVSPYGIKKNHVFANKFLLDKKGKVRGIDLKNPLSQENGKVKIVQSLSLPGQIMVIGDGYTDYQIKAMGSAHKFVAFTENIKRESVVKKADREAANFDEFLYVNKLPTSQSYPKNRIKALLLENIDNSAVVAFEKEGYEVEYHEKILDEDSLKRKLSEIRILGIRSRTEINPDAVSQVRNLLTIGAFCIGTDQIDLRSCRNRGIAVFNAPYSNTRSVVELVVGEMIILARGIVDKNRLLHNGTWNKTSFRSFELRGKTLGIVGYGNIGSQLSVLSEALGMKVIFHDIVERLPLGNAQKVGFSYLLKNSDIVSLHVDGRSENALLIGEKEFRLMKKGVLLINASRGMVVDINVLQKFITAGYVGGAAIDVFPNEPKSTGDRFVSILQNLPNVILTPHIGGSTKEAQKNIAKFVTGKIIDFINTGNTYLSVNLPSLSLPMANRVHRLLHLHRNVPGVLAAINSVLAAGGCNIVGQYLKTEPDVGYVITDIDKKYDSMILDQLKNIKETIRFRVLY